MGAPSGLPRLASSVDRRTRGDRRRQPLALPRPGRAGTATPHRQRRATPGGGERPSRWENVFASIQSINANEATSLDPEQFDVVIVDEFHHSAAASYEALLDHLRPKHLFGLTATPERTDGLDVLRWFDGRISIELRLWDALEQGLLSPFHYFGIHDATDLSGVTWRRGKGYDVAELTNIYTGDDIWTSKSDRRRPRQGRRRYPDAGARFLRQH